MFAPDLAAELRRRGHRVTAVAETPALRAMNDPAVFEWAAANIEWLFTENVKDFRPLLLAAQAGNHPYVSLLPTSSRSFLRSRKNPSPLTEAHTVWLERPDSRSPAAEEWLLREIASD
jgi:hypothetical protein